MDPITAPLLPEQVREEHSDVVSPDASPQQRGVTRSKTLQGLVKDKLQEAQVHLMHQADDRHLIYQPPSMSREVTSASSTAPVQNAEKEPRRSRSWAERGFRRAASEETGLPFKLRNLEPKRKVSAAYMGIDWYAVHGRQKRLSWLFLLENLYFWCYAGYISVAILLGAVAMWLLQPDEGLSFTQCVYSAAACVSQSGLAVVDWSQQAQSTYIVSFVLIIAGSASLLHMAPVLLRRLSFRMQTRLTQRLQELAADDASPGTRRRMRAHSDPGGLGEEPTQRNSAGRGAQHPCSSALSEMHRLEYKALGKVLRIVSLYWLTVHLVGWLIFVAMFKLGSGPIQAKLRREGLCSGWHAAYLTVSAFQNNGLVMTPSSAMDFRWSPLLLNTIGALVLAGNTCLPIAVRLIAWCLAERAAPDSERRHVLDFLLEHPRRCFTHMFPAVHTLWLLLVVAGLTLLQTAAMLWQDSHGKAFRWWDEASQSELQLGQLDRLWNSLFQAVSTRTAGINSVNIADLSQGTTFLMVVMMYFSTTPTVVTMRYSAGSAELDITGRAEGVEEQVLLGDNSLKSQARRYLTQDVTYLIFILFLICVLEKEQFAASARVVTPDSDGVYGDFSFFKVLFELVSAYGTCGFSLGYRNQTSSFSSVWSPPSQYLLVLVMVLGRLRGLPDSIDPSVRAAMAHGELTEHAFLHT